MDKIKISILIVNYRVKDELFKCIKSIIDSKQKIEYETIVVDNDEKKTIEKELKKEFPKVKYIKSTGNIGYGAGNNLGAKNAKGKYLFILNPDTKFSSGSFSKLISLFEINNKIGIVAPLLLDKKNNPYVLQGTKELTPKKAIFSLSFLSKLFPNNKIYKDYYLLGWNKNKLKEVDVVPGTAFVIKKELFDKLGGFDEKFFLFFEEFDLCRRIRKMGYRNYISPSFKLIHEWGVSTAQNSESQKYFLKSRLYYFRKHFGLIPALLTSLFLGVNKTGVLLVGIIILGTFLRLLNLSDLMIMISDQGWFFLSAKDMLITGNIPLVGITSSHTWLHQGPLWTYILAVALSMGNFNPGVGGYLSASIDILTIFFLYKVSRELFSKEVGLVTAVLYATSPLIIMFSRMPYHTSPIPLLATLFLLALYRWIKGSVMYFPITIFTCALLYNFELATILFPIIVIIFLLYGLLKKKTWAKIFNFKIISLSAFSFLIPMLPILLYDLRNGFPQTVKFAGWIFLEMLGLFGLKIVPSATHESTINFIHQSVDEYYRFIVFPASNLLSSVIFLVAIILNLLFVYKLYKTKNFKKSYIVFYVCLLVLLLGFFSQKAKSGAYLTMLFPYLVLMIALAAGYLTKFNKAVYYLLVVFIFPIFNVFYILNQYHQSSEGGLKRLIFEAKFIVDNSSGENSRLTKKNFRSNIDINQYRYLVWWKGGRLNEDSTLEYGIYNRSEGEPAEYIYEDNLIYITKTRKGQK